MTRYSFDASELTSEKSLWDIFRLSWRIKPSRSHVIITTSVLALLLINAFWLEKDGGTLLKDIREWTSFGFAFSISTLGFLVAGFTIFATLTKPEMLLTMMDYIHQETGLPTLKYNFFAFMRVFIFYILFATIYISVVLFGQSGGLISKWMALLPEAEHIKFFAVRLAYAFIGVSLIHLLLLLKTFIFNIYFIVMNSLRWEYYKSNQPSLHGGRVQGGALDRRGAPPERVERGESSGG